MSKVSKKKQLLQQIDEFAKKKNLLLTSIEKDIKGFDDL